MKLKIIVHEAILTLFALGSCHIISNMSFHQGVGRAHAKIILIGEHAVVYGHPGIALPFLPLGVVATITQASDDQFISDFYQGLLSQVPANLLFLQTLVQTLRTTLDLSPISIKIDNQIPPAGGMGSSAAISSAIVAACYDFAKQPLDDQQRFNLTQLAEKIVHGSASGIDALTTSHDQAWYFIKNKPPVILDLKVPGFLIVANSGIRGQTKDAVSQVAQLFTKNLAQAHLESIGLMGLLMKEAIERKEIDDMARLMNQAQFHLHALGVSHPVLDRMVDEALSLGALGAKLTGGGMGGCMIALTDELTVAQRIQQVFSKTYSPDVWMMDLT
jgi:mevalonate kinase